jgi:hypothetical protein
MTETMRATRRIELCLADPTALIEPAFPGQAALASTLTNGGLANTNVRLAGYGRVPHAKTVGNLSRHGIASSTCAAMRMSETAGWPLMLNGMVKSPRAAASRPTGFSVP